MDIKQYIKPLANFNQAWSNFVPFCRGVGWAVILFLMGVSLPTKAELVACDAVANQAKGYLPHNEVLATQQSLEGLDWEGELMGTLGGWSLYRTQQFALQRNDCRPQHLALQTTQSKVKWVWFYPVLKNQHTDRWAIFKGQFLVVASTKLTEISELADMNWRISELDSLSEPSLGSNRYMLYVNPSDQATLNYDQAVAILQRHPKISQFTPIFIEQRYHLR